VHRTLGPGLLESRYEQCLARELALADIPFEVQVPLPVEYKGVRLDCGYRVDLFVEKQLIIELKVVERFLPIHVAQLLTYMKLANVSVGLLMNFHVALLKDGGMKRFVL
jgi:GxxExxY protein